VRLLFYMYGMCSILTYFTSNDIVIISITPIIMHVRKHGAVRGPPCDHPGASTHAV
jgi:Na+/H+ antiporter NhaD/arsenite permease-like protein